VNSTVKVEIRQLPHGEGLALPAYQSAHAAGLDLLAAVPEGSPLILNPGAHALVPTGLSIALPPGHEAQVRPRSGLAANHGTVAFSIQRGERIAQMVIAPVVQAELVPRSSLSATDRGSGGFGSTGR
jgi:dUTP pyrophosphatase